jgi:uncharacterized protein YmfQ (DUF2313 family)
MSNGDGLGTPPWWKPLPPDVHVRRSGDDYAQAFLSLLPRGQAWPRDPESTLVLTCTGLSEYWGFVDGRAADLLETESFPTTTVELLSSWESAWGLPDPCFPDATSIKERQNMLVLKMTLLGGQSKSFFNYIAQWAGYEISIAEWAPFMCGVSEVGDTRYEYDDTGLYRWYIGPPENRYFFYVSANTAVLEWFRCGTNYSQCGIHPHLKIETESPLECLLNRWKPAHTELAFDYSSLQDAGPMAGTP